MQRQYHCGSSEVPRRLQTKKWYCSTEPKLPNRWKREKRTKGSNIDSCFACGASSSHLVSQKSLSSRAWTSSFSKDVCSAILFGTTSFQNTCVQVKESFDSTSREPCCTYLNNTFLMEDKHMNQGTSVHIGRRWAAWSPSGPCVLLFEEAFVKKKTLSYTREDKLH